MVAKPRSGAPKKNSHPKAAEASPIKSVAEELVVLRRKFKNLIRSYSTKIEDRLAEVQEAVASLDPNPDTHSGTRIHELRDMLASMRTLQVKPDKCRRKELKKYESLSEDLRSFIDGW